MDAARTGSGPHILRQLNTSAVLAALRAGGPMRIADLVSRTGLSRPAVSRAVEALRLSGWAAGANPGSDDAHGARIGRPAAVIRFRAEAGHVLGIDVGPHKILALVTDLLGEVVAERRYDARRLGQGSEVLDAILAVTDDVLAGIPAGSLMSAAVGTPGLVDPAASEVILAPSIPGWSAIPIAATLRERLACPVSLHNDVDLAVLAERWRGTATSVGTLVFLQWGARVGAGIMIGGRVHSGARSAAGELGFLDLAEEPEQVIGSTMGPFERQVGAAAIIELAVAEARRHGDTGLLSQMSGARASDDAAALFEAADAGNTLAAAIIDRICARLARGLAAVYLVLDPDLVVIGGGLSRAGPPLLTALERHLQRRTLVPPRLALSVLGDTAVAFGAIRTALDNVDSQLLAQDVPLS